MTVTLTWRRNAAARPCPPMATHANPGCGTDCRKHARTQLHRPDRPEPHRPRHALAVPSPQARASSLGSAAQPGRAGPGAAWEERGVVHGVYWIQFCIANANLHALRAGRKPPLFPCDTPAGPHALVAQTPHFATKPPPRDPDRQTRARCACRAALERRASNSASPPSLGRAPIPPDLTISKSTPRDLDFECPGPAFKIERAKCQVGAPSQSSNNQHDQAQFPTRF